MLCKLKNLLPDDTRIIEIASAIAMFISCLLVLFGVPAHSASPELVYFALGVSAIQLSSLVFLDSKDFIRVYSSLIMGGLLFYVGFSHVGVDSVFNYVTQFTLGFANLYAFLVNNQRLVWK